MTLPDDVRYELSYNTRTGGAAPLNVPGPYDSLNIGTYDATAVEPSVGSDPDVGILLWNGEPTDKGLGLRAEFLVGS